ncbi:MAG: Gfo/Idh/MocA family oxidoreductase [Planctomycetales bacterium]|nr:Gfo/Idh/MocA family oxidoreductase [Planctomycetales bacterium]
MTDAKTCRWGILSTASISRKNWNSIRFAENATLTAVASRDVSKAQQYIQENQLSAAMPNEPTAFGSYDELIKSDDVDAVYIPLPTALRKEWVIKAANAGKHVLCEKPCGCTVADLQEMLDACSRNNVQFMDGVMFMHSSRLPAMRQRLDDGESVGKIRRLSSVFCFNGGDEFSATNIRVNGATEPLGCLGDLGWYNIRFMLWAMNWELPTSVRGQILTAGRNNDGAPEVPIEFAADMQFANGVSGNMYCSFNTDLQQTFTISGDKGYLQVDDFVLPFYGPRLKFEVCKARFLIDVCDFNMEDRTQPLYLNEYSNAHESAQEVNMVRNFSANVLSGRVDPFWADVAMKTQLVCNACMDSARSGEAIQL